MARTFQVTFDSADPAAHSAFWAEALHYVVPPPPEGFDSWDAALDAWGVTEEHRNDNAALVDPDGVGPRIFFQKVPEPKTAKNRLHFDLVPRSASTRRPGPRRSRPSAAAWWHSGPAGSAGWRRTGSTRSASSWKTPKATSSVWIDVDPSGGRHAHRGKGVRRGLAASAVKFPPARRVSSRPRATASSAKWGFCSALRG